MPPILPPDGSPPAAPGEPHPIAPYTPYLQVADGIRRMIADQGLQPGERLPSYKEMAQAYRVSVATVQTAVVFLLGQGVLESRIGTGTYVADLMGTFCPTGMNRMHRYIRTGRIYPEGETATITGADLVPGPSYVLQALALPPQELVVRRSRVTRDLTGRVISMSTSWLPGRFTDAVPELLNPVPIPKGTIGAICQATGILPGRRPAGRDHLMARAATQGEAQALGIATGDPTLVSANWFYGQRPGLDGAHGDDVVLEYGESACPPGRVAAYDYYLDNSYGHPQ